MARSKKPQQRKTSTPRKAASTAQATGKKKSASAGRGRTRYSEAERQNILATAQREGLTAAKVKERFGVTPVTYYSWRKKSGATRSKLKGRGAAAGAAVGQAVANAMNAADTIREELRTYIRRILPGLIAEEFRGAEGGGRKKRAR